MKNGGKILIGVGVFALLGLLFISGRRKNSKNEDVSGCDGLSGNEKMVDMCNHLHLEHEAAEKELKNILKGGKSNFECAKKLIDVWSKEIKHHFGEEEKVVFPAILKKDKSFEPIINDLLKEHEYFYSIINSIKEKKCVGCGKLPKDFCNKLLKHIEKEEDLFKKLKK